MEPPRLTYTPQDGQLCGRLVNGIVECFSTFCFNILLNLNTVRLYLLLPSVCLHDGQPPERIELNAQENKMNDQGRRNSRASSLADLLGGVSVPVR